MLFRKQSDGLASRFCFILHLFSVTPEPIRAILPSFTEKCSEHPKHIAYIVNDMKQIYLML